MQQPRKWGKKRKKNFTALLKKNLSAAESLTEKWGSVVTNDSANKISNANSGCRSPVASRSVSSLLRLRECRQDSKRLSEDDGMKYFYTATLQDVKLE